MKLDRDLQKHMLQQLADAYPAKLNFFDGSTEEVLRAASNLLYLEGHGLVISGVRQYADGSYYSTGTEITSKGIDFVADDGGLGAILGVVTIKLHDDTIRELIALKIQGSDLPEPEKKKLLDQLRELRGESIKHLTMKLLDLGLENLPAALPAIQKSLAAFGG